MSDTHDARLNAKDFMVVIPLLGSAWAMSFGVGLFSAFGMSYIMMFTLSEHITAAIPSAAVALLFAILAYGGVYTSRWRTKLTSKWRAWQILRIVGWIIATAIILGGACWIWRNFAGREIGLIASVVLIITAGVICLFLFASEYPAPVFIGLAVATAVVAFLLGHISGSASMASKATAWEIVVGDKEPAKESVPAKEPLKYKGSLLYAGVKGVLLVVPSINRTHYVRMELIKELSREAPTGH
jgi:hypothetical protein